MPILGSFGKGYVTDWRRTDVSVELRLTSGWGRRRSLWFPILIRDQIQHNWFLVAGLHVVMHRVHDWMMRMQIMVMAGMMVEVMIFHVVGAVSLHSVDFLNFVNFHDSLALIHSCLLFSVLLNKCFLVFCCCFLDKSFKKTPEFTFVSLWLQANYIRKVRNTMQILFWH